MENRKIGIVGAGAVGASAAYALTLMGTCSEIVLFDVAPGVAQGKSIDIAQAGYYAPGNTNVTHVDAAEDMKNCDIVVITAGVPRKPGMTRADLLMINAKIMKDVVGNIVKNSPNAIIICVSNPLDVMTYAVHKISGWDRNRIIGMAGALDGSRMAYQIAQTTGVNISQSGSLVIGDHGENMIPLPHKVTIGDIPSNQLISKEEMQGIIERTRFGGAEIVKHLGTSGYYGPGRAIAHMVEAILDDTYTVVPSSTLLDGEYGYSDITVGVPVVLGKNGIEKVIELDLDDETKAQFKVSVDSIQEGVTILKENKII